MVFDCKPCGFEFNSGKELKDHEDCEHLFECPQCEETYPMQTQLGEHIKNYHKNRPINKEFRNEMFQCPHCPKIYKVNKTLKQHIKTKHVDGVSHKNNQKIQTHYDTRNENFDCAECEKVFWNKESLKQHIKEGHLDKKKVFTTENALKIDDYNEDDLYDEESSSDEDTGLTLNIKSLEEEENHLNNLKLKLKIVHAKASEFTNKEQQAAPRRREERAKSAEEMPKEEKQNQFEDQVKGMAASWYWKKSNGDAFFSTSTRICRLTRFKVIVKMQFDDNGSKNSSLFRMQTELKRYARRPTRAIPRER